MDGKSKPERPSQSESFDSFRGIKMVHTNSSTTSRNNNNSSNNSSRSGQRNGEPGNRHDRADTFQMRPTNAKLLCHSPEPGNIDEKDKEDTSIRSDTRIVQVNQNLVPSAPPRTHISNTPETPHSKTKFPDDQSYVFPERKPIPDQRCEGHGSSPPRKSESSAEPSAPSPSRGATGKMPTFVNDAEGFMGGLQVSHDENEKTDWFTSFLTVLSMIIVVMTFPFSMIFCLKIVAEYERAVVLRMGRLLPGGQGTRGPGLFFVLPCIDSVRTVELRTVTFSIPPQEVLTRDSVTVAVDAVVYYRICNPAVSILNVEDAARSTRLLAQTTLRNVLGTKDLAQILMDREEMSVTMQATIDAATEAWGVKVTS